MKDLGKFIATAVTAQTAISQAIIFALIDNGALTPKQIMFRLQEASDQMDATVGANLSATTGLQAIMMTLREKFPSEFPDKRN